MKVVHFESGLGNQMLDYVDYLLVKRAYPLHEVFAERLVFDIEDSHQVISMWNGFELDRVFGLDLPDIRTLFDERRWRLVKEGIVRSRFWENGWSYSEDLVALFSSQGLALQNSIRRRRPLSSSKPSLVGRLRDVTKNTRLGGEIRCAIQSVLADPEEDHILYGAVEGDELCGHSLMGMYKGYGIDGIRDELLRDFRFPPFRNDENRQMEELLAGRNAVAIHARRGDYIGVNGFCYKNGYFERATRLVKKSVESPLFVFFSDPSGLPWIMSNLGTFGLDAKRDELIVVDWNVGPESYRDMQLMSLCKHNIFTQSSFGWWGGYLNDNPNKITVAPSKSIVATHCR